MAKAPDTASAPKFRRARQVTVPTIKLENEKSLFLRFEKPMTVSTNQRKNANGEAEKPATVASVYNLETEQYAQIVVPEVLKSNLSTHYPNDSYVGKSFEIIPHGQSAGKRYRTFDMFELEADAQI